MANDHTSISPYHQDKLSIRSDSSSNSTNTNGDKDEEQWKVCSAQVKCHNTNEVSPPNYESVSFGDINVEHSSDVHFGSRTFYKGPVTIQFFQTNTNDSSEIPKFLKATTDIEVENIYNNNDVSTSDATKSTKKVSKWYDKKVVLIASIIVGVLALIIIITMISMWTGNSDTYSTSEPFSSRTTSQTTYSPSGTTSSPWEDYLPMVNRAEWGAMETNYVNLTLEHPRYVIISHTATPACLSQTNCARLVREEQKNDKKRGLGDISYNFLIGGDGNVYEGRGWNIQGFHSKNYDDKCLGIAFLGNFTNADPKRKQLRVAMNLLEFAVKKNKVTRDYRLLGQCQIDYYSESPGYYLYQVIKKWDHWVPKP